MRSILFRSSFHFPVRAFFVNRRRFAMSTNTPYTPWPARQTGSSSRRRGTGTAFGWHWSSATMLPAGSALTTPPGSAVIAISGRAKARGHSGIESSTAGLVPGALPPGLAGSGASCPLQLGFSSQSARNARRSARRNPRLGAIAAGLADGFLGIAGKRGDRTLGASRGRYVGSRPYGTRDLGPGDMPTIICARTYSLSACHGRP